MSNFFTKNEIEQLIQPHGGSLQVKSLEQSYIYCRKKALGHYENFPVGSLFIPKPMQKHFFAIYAFSRLSDDIADEPNGLSADERIAALNALDSIICKCSNRIIEQHPIFWALSTTMKERNLPTEPFCRLLEAFRRDCLFVQPESLDDVFEYCSYSANPVGELVLRLFNNWNERNRPLSDAICTGLQLANFWQDFSLDIKNGRCYIPLNIMKKYGIKANYFENNLLNEEKTIIFINLFNQLLALAQEQLEIGKCMVAELQVLRLKFEIAAVIEGGCKIIRKTKSLRAEIINQRPELSKFDMLVAATKAFFKVIFGY
jgi:squalene synthase HpnC